MCVFPSSFQQQTKSLSNKQNGSRFSLLCIEQQIFVALSPTSWAARVFQARYEIACFLMHRKEAHRIHFLPVQLTWLKQDFNLCAFFLESPENTSALFPTFAWQKGKSPSFGFLPTSLQRQHGCPTCLQRDTVQNISTGFKQADRSI